MPQALGRFRTLWWLPALLAIAVAYRTSTGFGLLADARFLVVENRLLDGVQHLWGNLTHDYFWSSSGNHIPYWRPLTKASWLLEVQLWGRNPPGFHLVQLAWLLLGALGVTGLARTLGATRLWAALAGLLFGLHPAVVEPACLVMARSDVVAATGAIWTLLAWQQWRLRGDKTWLLLHLLALMVALGSKESSVALAPVLTLWAWWTRPTEPRLAWLRTVTPVWFLCIVYGLLRTLCLGSHAGAPLVLSPLRVLVGAGVYLQALWPLAFQTGVRNLTLAEAAAPPTWVPALVLLMAFALLGLWLLRTRRFGALALWLWIAASLAPVLLVEQLNVPGVEGKFPLANRWLLQAVAATAVLLALLASALRQPRWAHTLAGIVGLWALATVAIAPSLHEAYASETAMLSLEDHAFLATPERFRTLEDRCRAGTRALLRATGSFDPFAYVPAECRNRPDDLYNLVAALLGQHRIADARRLLTDLLAHPPLDRRFAAPLRLMAAQIFLESGQPQRALRLLREAERLGVRDPEVHQLLQKLQVYMASPAGQPTPVPPSPQ